MNYPMGDHNFVDADEAGKPFGYWCTECGVMLTSISQNIPCAATKQIIGAVESTRPETVNSEKIVQDLRDV